MVEALEVDCGAPLILDGFWQCFLKIDAPPEPKDLIPHDIAKLHCCQKVSRSTTVFLLSFLKFVYFYPQFNVTPMYKLQCMLLKQLIAFF